MTLRSVRQGPRGGPLLSVPNQTLKNIYVQFLAMLAQSSEFENMAVREEELPELDNLVRSACPFEAKGGPENKHGKINILLQVNSLALHLCRTVLVRRTRRLRQKRGTVLCWALPQQDSRSTALFCCSLLVSSGLALASFSPALVPCCSSCSPILLSNCMLLLYASLHWPLVADHSQNLSQGDPRSLVFPCISTFETGSSVQRLSWSRPTWAGSCVLRLMCPVQRQMLSPFPMAPGFFGSMQRTANAACLKPRRRCAQPNPLELLLRFRDLWEPPEAHWSFGSFFLIYIYLIISSYFLHLVRNLCYPNRMHSWCGHLHKKFSSFSTVWRLYCSHTLSAYCFLLCLLSLSAFSLRRTLTLLSTCADGLSCSFLQISLSLKNVNPLENGHVLRRIAKGKMHVGPFHASLSTMQSVIFVPALIVDVLR